MAGKIIVSTLQSDTDNSISFVANTGATIFSANISHGIAGSFIADGSITGAKSALGSITGDDIATGQITGNLIATGQITGNLIATNAISQNNIVSVNASVASVGTLPKARLPAGTVLQVVSNTKTDTFTTSSTTDVAITGLFATITPTSASSKILILVNVGASGTTIDDYTVYLSLYRSASVITGALGNAASNRKVCSSASRIGSSVRYNSVSIMHQDSPASTSSLTYACYVSMESGGGTACINRSANDGDSAVFPRPISSITVMEIAA
jgi:hypothetical protein